MHSLRLENISLIVCSELCGPTASALPWKFAYLAPPIGEVGCVHSLLFRSRFIIISLKIFKLS